MKRILTSMGILLGTSLLVSHATAQEYGEADTLLQPRFQFQHQVFSKGSQLQYEDLLPERRNRTNFLLEPNSLLNAHVEQYDATISYPVRADKSMNLDLGVNIRFIEADFKGTAQDATTTRINTTLPMLYATALFNLPFDGLSASVGGSHAEFEDYRAFDYKAKLSYEWQNGLGLEGGWQHQRFNIDSSDVQADFETKGPFLDLKYRF